MLAHASMSVPSTEKCSRQKLAHLRQIENSGHELGGNIARKQPVAVLAEHRCIPHRIVRRQTHEPAEEQIIVELIDQQTLGAHTIESLEQQRAQKPLGWNAGPSMPGIELGECPRQTMEHFIDKHTD